MSYRDVEELLAERGIDVSYETVRRWVLIVTHLAIEENLLSGLDSTDRRHLQNLLKRWVLALGDQIK